MSENISKNSLNKPKQQKLPFLEDFLLFLTTSNYSQATIRNYERDLLTFDDFLIENDIDFDQVTKKTVTIYTADLLAEDRTTLTRDSKGSKLSPKSINRMLTSIRSYLTYLIDTDCETPILPQHVKLMKLGKKVMHLPPIETLIQFIESPEQFENSQFIGIRNRVVLELIFASGMRISEVVSLKASQVEEDGKLYIRGKGNKERFVYLTPRSLALLHKYLEVRKQFILEALPTQFQTEKYVREFEYLFITKKNFDTLREKIEGTELPTSLLHSHISENYLQGKIKTYRLRLGISQPVSAHTLRHGFATYLAESGANPAALKVLLGHESLETTTKYVHASDTFAETTHEQFHPLKK